MTDSNEQHLSDYLAILRRRRKPSLVIASVIILFSALLAMFWPPVYRSTATILIEQQQIPQDLVPSSVTSYAGERIQIISKRAMTRENLLRVEQQFDLFPGLRQAGDISEILQRMRKGIIVDMLDAQVNDPRSGASGKANIAFELSYEARTPEAAESVAKELVTVFLRENIRILTEKAEGASEFLGEESQRLSQRISELEARLAEFKSKNTGRLPELMTMNMSMLDRSQRDIEEAERQIYNLDERKLLLQSQLSQVEPYAGLNSPGGRLRMAQSEYLSAMAKYSPDHPDVVRARREVEALKKEAGIQDGRDTIEAEYKKVRAELAAAREKYAEDHPDAIRLKNSLAILGEKLKAAPSSEQRGIALKPDNPAYISLLTQQDTVELNLKEAKERRARLKEKVRDYESRITQTPHVEQEGLSLQREYDNAVKKFREIKDKELQAGGSEQLEKGSRGERFTVLEPPQLPTRPVRPNRSAIILLGLVFALGGGVGYASYAEYMDRTIRGSRSVRAVLRTPPLAVIPYIAPVGNVLPGSGKRVEGVS